MNVRTTILSVCCLVLVAVPAVAQLPGGSIPNPTPRTLSANVSSSAPAGGTINLNGVPLPSTTVYTDGTSLTLTAAPIPGSIFTGWSGDCSGTGNCSVTMNGNKSVTASFRLPVVRVTKSGNGSGTVSGTVLGVSIVNCGSDCSESVLKGTSVSWSANPGTGFADGSSCGSSTTVNNDVTCDFKFTKPRLTVSKTGSGASAGLVSGTGINCGSDCSEDYDLNTPVQLTATPASDNVVRNWSGGCRATPCTMTANKTVTVDMGKPTIAAKLLGTGGGVVTSEPTGMNCTSGTCTVEFPMNTTVRLTATANATSRFDGWTGECQGTGTTCDINNSSKPTASVSATFTRVYKLTVTKVGEGSVSGGGIDCGNTCMVRLTNGNASVTLTAAPAPGWSFKGWSGACTVTTATCTLNMGSNDRTVTATFSK